MEESPQPDSGKRRFLVIDFIGVGNGLKKLEELLQENADYFLLASTLPVGKTLETLREELSGCADRLVGEISSSLEGRYFAIQKFLQTTPEGRQAVWLAVDSEPRRFPESCSELVAMNPAFGFDDAVAQRLRDAMRFTDQRARVNA